MLRRREDKDVAARRAKFIRGEPVATRKLQDKKLRGQLRHSEALAKQAVEAAAKTDAWLLPAEGGELEAEGMERTWRFSQVHPLYEMHLLQVPVTTSPCWLIASNEGGVCGALHLI